MVAKRVLSAALTVIGLVLVLVGAWFTVHLGSSGSATLRSTPAGGAVVVVEPSLLNRVAAPTSVTAYAAPGTSLWMGRTTPTDAAGVIGTADHTNVTGGRVRDWSLVSSREGSGPAADLAAADVWRQTATGQGRVRLTVEQSGAPESVVIASPDGGPVQLTRLTVTVERKTWFFQALLVTLVGLIATVTGVAGLWQTRPRRGSQKPSTPEPSKPAATTEPGKPAATTEPGKPAATTEPGKPAATTEEVTT